MGERHTVGLEHELRFAPLVEVAAEHTVGRRVRIDELLAGLSVAVAIEVTETASVGVERLLCERPVGVVTAFGSSRDGDRHLDAFGSIDDVDDLVRGGSGRLIRGLPVEGGRFDVRPEPFVIESSHDLVEKFGHFLLGWEGGHGRGCRCGRRCRFGRRYLLFVDERQRRRGGRLDGCGPFGERDSGKADRHQERHQANVEQGSANGERSVFGLRGCAREIVRLGLVEQSLRSSEEVFGDGRWVKRHGGPLEVLLCRMWASYGW